MSIDLFALDEIAQLREHFILLNGSPEAISVLLDPGITPASFDTWLATAGKLALFQQLIAAPSSIAAVAANTTSMAAVAASSTAMAAVAASSVALMVVHGQDVALNAIKGSAVAMAAMRSSAKYMLTTMISYASPGATIPGTVAGASYIAVGISSSNWVSGQSLTINTRRSGSAVSNSGLVPGIQSADGKAIDLAIPIVAPFTGVNSSTSGYQYAIGLVRCDA